MKSEIKEGVLIIFPHGNLLNEQNNASVMDLIKKNIESRTTKVLFNLREMNFMNSSGLSLLLFALPKIRNAGGELALCSVPEQTKRLLQMTKLESVFGIYKEEEHAIAALKN